MCWHNSAPSGEAPPETLPCLKSLPDGSLLLRVYVQPRSSREEVVGLQEQSLKLRLTSPPVDGKANKALVAYLAKIFHLSKSSFTIHSGEQSRHKTLRIQGITEKQLLDLLQQQKVHG